jgi:hypothetical protein
LYSRVVEATRTNHRGGGGSNSLEKSRMFLSEGSLGVAAFKQLHTNSFNLPYF